MPEFLRNVSSDAVRVAFPFEFESLIVSLFLRDDGYIGLEGDNVDTQQLCWYGMSWPMIDRDVHLAWRKRSREIRREFRSTLWRYVRSLGKENAFARYQLFFASHAYLNAWPRIAFDVATERLIREGCIEHRRERGVHMYYPLPALAERIAVAKWQLKANA